MSASPRAMSYELPTFRKTRATDAEETVQKINRYIAKLEPRSEVAETSSVEDPLFDFNSKAATCHYSGGHKQSAVVCSLLVVLSSWLVRSAVSLLRLSQLHLFTVMPL